ncbi:MAG TPA: enoyl-CoA hydratase [Ilumatobacteraceae bacterium]|nr:enoyl-CoA hydratase [Ilumatobacteraceae bacterium]
MAEPQDDKSAPYESLRVDRSGGVVTITLDRPERKNAINGAMWNELSLAVAEIARSSADRVVVITGAGGEFCSGADLSEPSAGDDHHLTRLRRVGDLCLAIARLPQPTIAKVRGVAVGAGLNLALVCDMVVAAEGSRFSEIFARRGLSLDFGGSWILPRLVGMHRAKELALLARIIDAQEAAAIGLVNRVMPDAELDAFVDGWASELAAGPPIALALTKRMLNNSFNVTLEEALDDEGVAQTVNLGTADNREAVAAFLAKRAPRFEGR